MSNRRSGGRFTQKRPNGIDPKQADRKVKELEATAQKAIQYLSTDEADALIGPEQPEELALLIRGMAAAVSLQYLAMIQGKQIKNDERTQTSFSKIQVIMGKLIHTAYALGKREATPAPIRAIRVEDADGKRTAES